MSRGPWLQTFTGRQFWPLDPRPEDVCVEDVAHALSQLCRFGGHTRVPYSVADHSIHVSELVPAEHRLAALLHDATEAYVVDLPRPIKRVLLSYQNIERGVATAVGEAFGVDLRKLPDPVEHADMRMLATELSLEGIEPVPHLHLEPLTPAQSEAVFLDLFNHYS